MEALDEMQLPLCGKIAGMFQRRWKSWPYSMSSAPNAFIAAFFDRLLPSGTTMVLFRPLRAAAKATLWP